MPPSSLHTIHPALSPWDLTDDYNRHAGVTLLSFLDHCSEDTHVIVHLLYDAKLSIGKEQETEYNKSCYQKIAERYNSTVIFHPVELTEWINDVPAVKNWTPGTLLRLCLPGLLPDVDIIIYVDCDMVITSDMETLWNVPLGEKYLAAVPDSAVPNFGRKRRNYCKRKNILLDGYFCAGTLVLNLQKLREGPETLGMVYIEALGCGCFVIGSRGEGIDGVIIHDVNGLLVQPKDIDALVSTLKYYFNLEYEKERNILHCARETSLILTESNVARDCLEHLIS